MPVFKVQEHFLQASYIREYPRALADEHDDDLRIAVKQYTPLTNLTPHDDDITIIGTHANGFPKELYEPLWEELYNRLRDQGHGIRHIFILDAAFQGQSGVLNASKLGNDPSWLDVARDLFLMVNHFRNEIKQPIIGIGHSMGGNNLVNLAHMHPRLFTSLIMIDPVIMRRPSGEGAFTAAAASSRRRDRWPNLAEAEQSFKRSKFYQSWDPRVLNLWFKYGLREVPKVIETSNNASLDEPMNVPFEDPEVVLTTTKHQEVFTFVRPGVAIKGQPAPYPQPNLPLHLTHPDLASENGPEGPFYRPELSIAFQRLITLRPSALFIFASNSDLSDEALNADKLASTGTGPGGSGGVKARRVKGVTIEGAGHLVPFEKVAAVAEHCVTWIVPELARAIEERDQVRRDWNKVPVDEKAVLSEGVMKSLASYLPSRPQRKPEQPKDSKL